MPRLSPLCLAFAATALLVGGAAPSVGWPAAVVLSQTSIFAPNPAMDADVQRKLQSGDEAADATFDPTYQAIQELNGTVIDSNCYVAISLSEQLVVWCDIAIPVGLDVKAEIRDGTCEEFTDAASGDSYLLGVARPVYLPEITEDEKRQGTFDHAYCARMDVLYDLEGTGESVSVMERRFPMEVTYNYFEKDGENGAVEEELASATLADAGTKVEENNEKLMVGLGVLAGAIVTLALVAIVSRKKKREARRGWERREAERTTELELEERGNDAEVMATAASAKPSTDENEII
ncbi:hypothetical protein ACHAXT_002605 [Thalassiosira profunda]